MERNDKKRNDRKGRIRDRIKRSVADGNMLVHGKQVFVGQDSMDTFQHTSTPSMLDSFKKADQQLVILPQVLPRLNTFMLFVSPQTVLIPEIDTRVLFKRYICPRKQELLAQLHQTKHTLDEVERLLNEHGLHVFRIDGYYFSELGIGSGRMSNYFSGTTGIGRR